MSQENVEIVRTAYNAYNRGDLEAFSALLAPDATADPLPYWPESKRRHGREEIIDLLRDIRAPLEKNAARAEKIVDGGDQVVAAHVWGGVVKGTEDEVEASIGMTVTLRAGKITDIRWFRTFDEALEAARLRK